MKPFKTSTSKSRDREQQLSTTSKSRDREQQLSLISKSRDRERQLSSTCNTRSILPTGNRYIRSDVPVAISEKDREWLLANNIRTIVDLRGEEEQTRKPCPLKELWEFQYYNLPVSGGNAIPAFPEQVPVSYLNMLDGQMHKIIDVIEGSPANVLYFCNAGKDRTGVVSAILLKRAGISDAYIISDYTQSAGNLKTILNSYVNQNPNIDINVITPKAEYMKAFLEGFYETDFAGRR